MLKYLTLNSKCITHYNQREPHRLFLHFTLFSFSSRYPLPHSSLCHSNGPSPKRVNSSVRRWKRAANVAQYSLKLLIKHRSLTGGTVSSFLLIGSSVCGRIGVTVFTVTGWPSRTWHSFEPKTFAVRTFGALAKTAFTWINK